MYNLIKFSLLLIISSILGCNNLGSGDSDGTLNYNGTVNETDPAQVISREIRRGMTQDEVEKALGNPTIVARNATENETWVYERVAGRCVLTSGGISSEANRGEVLKLVDISHNRSPSWEDLKLGDKPLSVKITFNRENRVESFSYESSKH